MAQGETGPVGLDYGAVLRVFDLYAEGNTQALFADVQVMEARALTLFSEAAAKARKQAEAKSKGRKPRRR